jgi:hypothetical protein
MSDKLISQFEEGIPADDDLVLYEQSSSPGSYKFARKSNVGTGGGGGATTLTAPPSFNITITGSTTATANWGAVSSESGFQLQQSPAGAGTWTTIATPAANATSQAITGLSPSTTYDWRIKSVGDGVTYLDSSYSTDTDTTTSGSSFDTESSTFFADTSITDATIRNAIDTHLTKGFKTDGVWSKGIAIYPFAGGNATAHSRNLKNSADSDSAFRITWNGSITHNANGVTFPASGSAYGDTHLNPSNTGHLPSMMSSALLAYSKTANPGGDSGADTFALIGAYSDSSGTKAFWIAAEWAADLVQSQIGTSVVLNTTDADTQALFGATRRSTTDAELYLDGVSVNTNVTTETDSPPNFPVYIGALNYNGTDSFHARNFNLAFAAIFTGLTDTDMANINTRVAAFQTALSRNNP